MRHLLLITLLLTALATLAQAPVHRSARTHRATPTHATAPTAGKQLAYYCASGNAIKYHRSSTYRDLNRCCASVLALSEAQQQMEPCKIYHQPPPLPEVCPYPNLLLAFPR